MCQDSVWCIILMHSIAELSFRAQPLKDIEHLKIRHMIAALAILTAPGISPSDSGAIEVIMVINLIFGLFVFSIFGIALVQTAVEMFKKHPWEGVKYGNTVVSDAIARAMLGEEKVPKQVTRPQPVPEPSISLDASKLRRMAGVESDDNLTWDTDHESDWDTGIQDIDPE